MKKSAIIIALAILMLIIFQMFFRYSFHWSKLGKIPTVTIHDRLSGRFYTFNARPDPMGRRLIGFNYVKLFPYPHEIGIKTAQSPKKETSIKQKGTPLRFDEYLKDLEQARIDSLRNIRLKKLIELCNHSKESLEICMDFTLDSLKMVQVK